MNRHGMSKAEDLLGHEPQAEPEESQWPEDGIEQGVSCGVFLKEQVEQDDGTAYAVNEA